MSKRVASHCALQVKKALLHFRRLPATSTQGEFQARLFDLLGALSPNQTEEAMTDATHKSLLARCFDMKDEVFGALERSKRVTETNQCDFQKRYGDVADLEDKRVMQIGHVIVAGDSVSVIRGFYEDSGKRKDGAI